MRAPGEGELAAGMGEAGREEMRRKGIKVKQDNMENSEEKGRLLQGPLTTRGASA